MKTKVTLIVEHIRTPAGARFSTYTSDEDRRVQLIQYYNEVHADGEPLDDDVELEEVVDAIEEIEDVSTEEITTEVDVEIPVPASAELHAGHMGSWLSTVWGGLQAWREDLIPEGDESYDEQWNDACTAMAWITEALNADADDDIEPTKDERSDWVYAVGNGDTKRGLIDWVRARREDAEEDATHDALEIGTLAQMATEVSAPELQARYAFASPGSDENVELSLSAEDAAKFERGHWGPVSVFDHKSGKTLFVQGADCGAACFCAAEIVSAPAIDWDAPLEWSTGERIYRAGYDDMMPNHHVSSCKAWLDQVGDNFVAVGDDGEILGCEGEGYPTVRNVVGEA